MSNPSRTRRSDETAGTPRAAVLSAVTAGDGDSQTAIDRTIKDLALSGLRTNSRINVSARVLLGLFGLACAVVALDYVHQRGDLMVEILREPGTGSGVIGERMLALTMPVLLFCGFAGVAGAVTLVLHSRGQEETGRTLEALNRMKREGEVAVSARGLTFAFEEKLTNARRAFTLLLWLARTLFIVCLGMFAVSVFNAIISGVDLFTVALGGTSVVAALLAVALSVPDNVTQQLANVIQIQSIVTGCDRQISLLESDAMSAMNNSDTEATVAHGIVLDVQDRIDKVVSHAVQQIEDSVDPTCAKRQRR
jgi:hypothetical protein